VPKKAEEPKNTLKRGDEKKPKKGRKKKKKINDDEDDDDDVSSGGHSSASDEEDREGRDKNNGRKATGRKNLNLGQNSIKNSNKNRPTKLNRSGEYKGLDGGSKSNIISTTTTTTRHHNNDDVAKGDTSAKGRAVAAKHSSETIKKESSENKGILNRAIGRLLEQRQSDAREGDAADADVEDEVDDRAAGGGKAKAATESPAKKLKKRSPDAASQRLKRAAASKASDRIARESRGSIHLDRDSSSSSDPEDSVKVKKKLEIFSKKFDRSKAAAAALAARVSCRSDSDFEDENVTLAAKFKKGSAVRRKSSVDGGKKKPETAPQKPPDEAKGSRPAGNSVSSQNSKQNQVNYFLEPGSMLGLCNAQMQ
jgi:hypothetical protein